MARVRLLASVADDKKGAVVEMDDERAAKLIRTGYAEAVDREMPSRRRPS